MSHRLSLQALALALCALGCGNGTFADGEVRGASFDLTDGFLGTSWQESGDGSAYLYLSSMNNVCEWMSAKKPMRDTANLMLQLAVVGPDGWLLPPGPLGVYQVGSESSPASGRLIAGARVDSLQCGVAVFIEPALYGTVTLTHVQHGSDGQLDALAGRFSIVFESGGRLDGAFNVSGRCPDAWLLYGRC